MDLEITVIYNLLSLAEQKRKILGFFALSLEKELDLEAEKPRVIHFPSSFGLNVLG